MWSSQSIPAKTFGIAASRQDEDNAAVSSGQKRPGGDKMVDHPALPFLKRDRKGKVLSAAPPRSVMNSRCLMRPSGIITNIQATTGPSEVCELDHPEAAGQSGHGKGSCGGNGSGTPEFRCPRHFRLFFETPGEGRHPGSAESCQCTKGDIPPLSHRRETEVA